MMEMERND